MSKFLKFIVHFVVICTILCVVALALPPFLGVTTEIMDNSSKETNLAMGSVTYAIPVKTEEMRIGQPILVQEESMAYRYNIVTMDTKEKLFTVIDPTVSQAESITVAVKDYVPKVVITVPYLGYLLVATQSIEGLIVLGLAVLFLIILYVIAELWKRDPQDDYEDEDTEPGYVKSKKELKREEQARERRYKEEEHEIRREDKQRKKNKKKIRTGGFVDEIYEDELEPEKEERPVTMQRATSEAHELLKKEIAAATAEETASVQETIQPTVNIPETVAKETEVHIPEEVQEEEQEPVPVQKMAVPVWSAAQLADAAQRQGDAPDIVKDDITNVTLFDYSDIIAEDGEAAEKADEEE